MPSLACWRLRGNDTVAKLPRLPRETRRLSCGRIDDVEAAQHRVDAVDATTPSSSSFHTLSQCQDCSIEDLSCHLRSTDSLAAASTASRRREDAIAFIFCAESLLDRTINVEGTRQI